jgi:N-acetylglucosamine kinase-like BadF-type ATPase
MEIYLGLDGGGTKTAALIMDADGRVLGEGTGGPGNVAHNPDSVLRHSIQDACSSAASGKLEGDAITYSAVCAGIAGYSVETKRNDFEDLLRREVRAERYRIEPDYLIAYWGATHGDPGIVVVAGTGAVAFGRNESGVMYRADGLGYLLGDRGSGFDLGLYALRYTLHMMEEGRTDDLSAAVVAHTGATRQTEIVQWLYGNFNPARVASLSPIVGGLAETGDIAARNLVSEMARRLRHTVRDVRHKLWLPRDTPVYPLGRLWLLGEFFRSEFAEPTWPGGNGVTMPPEPTTGGYFNLVEPKNDAAYGAALLAKDDDSVAAN